MRKIMSVFLLFILSGMTGFAALPVGPSALTPAPLAPAPLVKASSIRIPVGSTGKFINLQELSTIKTADFEALSGRKMSWLRRMEVKLAQKKIRRSINADGTVNDKRLATMAGGYYEIAKFTMAVKALCLRLATKCVDLVRCASADWRSFVETQENENYYYRVVGTYQQAACTGTDTKRAYRYRDQQQF